MLVLNEADRLPRTLGRLERFAEIVVLDSGSTDGSLEICTQHRALVHRGRWKGFGLMRRELFSYASQPWVFWLDADEVVTDDLLAELERMDWDNPPFDGLEVNRIVRFEDRWIRHGDWFPDWNLRLFRRDRWSMEPKSVHESVSVSGRIGRLEGLLEHHTYRDWQDLQTRSQRYARLWASEMAGKGRRVSILAPYLHAAWRLFKGYVLKRGILDGWLGWRIALANAREVLSKYRLLRGHATR